MREGKGLVAASLIRRQVGRLGDHVGTHPSDEVAWEIQEAGDQEGIEFIVVVEETLSMLCPPLAYVPVPRAPLSLFNSLTRRSLAVKLSHFRVLA